MRLYEFILFELTDKVKNLLQTRYEAENPDTDPNEIRQNIDKWDQYVNSIPKEHRDITRLDYLQVKRIIDDAQFKTEIRGRQKTDTSTDPSDLVYDRNNLTIYRGDSKPKCIRYGDGYSWCISRSDASNLFYSYRMRTREPMFYFVFDKNRERDDPLHATVVYVNNMGQYHLATARNTGDEEYTWEELAKLMPRISGLKSVFKPQPLSDIERLQYEKYHRKLELVDVYDAFSMREKYEYFMFGNSLTDEQQDATPDELIGVYAKNFIPGITMNTWSRLKSGDKKKIQYDAAQHAEPASYLARFILQKPWFLTGLPYARNTDRLINNMDDRFIQADYDELIDISLERDKSEITNWLETADTAWAADIITLYDNIPIKTLSESRLFELLKQIHKNHPKYSIHNRARYATGSVEKAFVRFLNWAVRSRKDYEILDQYRFPMEMLEALPTTTWKHAMRLGLEPHQVPKSVRAKLQRVRKKPSDTHKEKWRDYIRVIDKLMREHDEVLDNLDPFIMDQPNYIKKLIQQRKDAIVAERT